MLGWFISLALTLIIALGALIPGAVDRVLTQELQARLGNQGTASVHVEGDPFLQLPFGIVPRVDATLKGYRLQEFAVREVALSLNDLHLDPGALMNRRAVLTAPVGAAIAVKLGVDDLQQALTALDARGTFRNLRGEVEFFGRRIGGTVNVLTPTVRLSDERLVISGEAELVETGARMSFTASTGLALRNQRQVVLVDPRLAVNGRPLPPALYAGQLARFNPLLDLSQIRLPPGEWALKDLDLTSEGLTVKADGRMNALPTFQ